MERINKFIKIACLLALFLVIAVVGWGIYQIAGIEASGKANFFLPFAKNKTKAEFENKNNDSLKILFLGDLMLDRHVGEKIKAKGFDYLFAGLNTEIDFKSFDVINANLEGAVTDNGAHYPPVMAYDFAFAPDVIANLKNYNLNYFNLANNHLSDQGEQGVKETYANLAKLNMKSYGCPDGQTGDCGFYIADIGGFKIGFLGFSMVYKKFDLGKAAKLVADLNNKTDLVIANIHWGTEYEHYFNKTQTETAYQLIDAGADLIIGHHPHVVEGIEIYNGKPIFYSLGNFIFDQYFSADTQEELAVALEFNSDKKVAIKLLPLISRQAQPSLMIGADKEKYLKKIAGWSKGDEKFKRQISDGEIKINF